MGCPLSKSGNDSDNQNQSKTGENKNGEGAVNKPLDPRLPLNVRQKFNLSKSWKGIAREMDMTGVLMFVKLFEDNAELLKLFTSFQELKTKQSQMESMELQEHASKVMGNLDEMISSLDNMDYFITHLHSVGKLHRKLPDFKKEYFFKMEKAFLEAVKEVLQDRYTENMENIYNIIIKLILQTVAEGYENDYD
ncbi:hypothetical protein RDWZM_009511 [Blomia tropicalis]|uniref:Globin domain-containing protein n=1 Tax=Blomia tropicalis TaxID=40697 RepID=A0A9Q0M3K1_BLOTA|nr:hypothetical protein BLOT_011846 [Blomia tropicalis]KAJ6218354.1 hypothetical protein RDWZM_009511 [Blomia tropicalis]